jgi:signal transduction histidine kinase
VLSSTLGIIARKVSNLPQSFNIEPSVARAKRNLDRLLEIQYEVEDIMENKDYESHQLLITLLDNCKDELQALVALETGDESIAEKIGKRIEDIYGTKTSRAEKIQLDDFVKERIKHIEPRYSHRQVELKAQYKPVPTILIPLDVLSKVVDGLVKNAIENTPDQGKIEIKVQPNGERAELIVHDYGVGITEDNQRRIFEGFYTTQETLDYSSKKPFDFNAGGKGADLLRMRIFAERYNFKIEMESTRCGFIPQTSDICPGMISQCNFCKEENDCFQSGGTIFSVSFPPQSESS